jgi:hypothetical protein
MVEGAKGRAKPLTRSGVFQAVHASEVEAQNDNGNGFAGPGLSSVRTRQPYSTEDVEGQALSGALDGRPWSRRRLAEMLGLNEKIVRDWCDGRRPIQRERLMLCCPVVWSRWQSRLAVLRGEESAA